MRAIGGAAASAMLPRHALPLCAREATSLARARHAPCLMLFDAAAQMPLPAADFFASATCWIRTPLRQTPNTHDAMPMR